MPQTAGKPVKKSSKTKSKSSSTSKRHFTVVIGTKEHGLYCSSSPSSAARKAVSKLCGKEKGKKVEFCLREITQGSKKKTYGPYIGHIEKLAKPIELKGRVIERKPVAFLKPKSSAKKGGMRGGDFFNDIKQGKNIENLNNKMNNDSINVLKELRNKTGKYRDISDKDLIKLIKYAIQQIQIFGPLGNNAPNMNDLPTNLSVYRNIYPDFVKYFNKVFFTKNNNNN